MMSLLEKLKSALTGAGERSDRDDAGRGPRRRDPSFGGPRSRELDNLPPERAAELAGHAPERVDT
jgi:hypothetical protein